MAHIPDDSFVLNRSKVLADLLRTRHGAHGQALGQMTSSVAHKLPISTVLALRRLAEVRNKVIKDRQPFPVQIGRYNEDIDRSYFEQLSIEVEKVLDGSVSFSNGVVQTEPSLQLAHEKIAVQAFNGKYVAANLHLNNELVADRQTVQEWETFDIFWLGENKVALRASNNSFVMANLDQNGILVACAQEIQGWETYTIHYVADGKIALQAFNGLFVGANINEQGQLVAGSPHVQGWESFTLIFL